MRSPPRKRISRSWSAQARRRAARDRRHRRRAGPDRRRRRPGRARGRGRLVPARSSTDEPCLEIEGGRHPVVEERAGRRGERFVANDLRARAERPAVAGHRPQHGRQVDLPAPERADRAARPGRQLSSPPRAPRSAWSTACSAASARRTISPAAARPSWSRWSRPPRSSPRRRRAAWSSSTRSAAAPRPMTGSPSPGRWSRRCTTRSRCRCLFATHYHELTRLADRLDALSLHHVRAREWKGDLVLLHEVAEGAADRSYGIAVAKLAGRAAGGAGAGQVGAGQAGGGPRRDRRDRRGARRAAAVRRAAAAPKQPPRPARRRAGRDRPRRADPARGARAALRAETRRRLLPAGAEREFFRRPKRRMPKICLAIDRVPRRAG